MKWVESNPIGALLTGFSGLLLLVAVLLGYLWSRPPEGFGTNAAAPSDLASDAPASGFALGPLKNYQVIVDRPLFNESRRPVVIEVDEEPEVEEPVVKAEPTKPPKLRLTGVVITPDQQLVTLTPEQGGEALILSTGMALEGEEMAGWSVDTIDARKVTLRSRQGKSLDLELTVFDQVIKEPPKLEPRRPEPDPETAAEPAEGEPQLSRAEQIRQRIQERREQLRAQANQRAEEEAASPREKVSMENALQQLIRRSAGNGTGEEEN